MTRFVERQGRWHCSRPAIAVSLAILVAATMSGPVFGADASTVPVVECVVTGGSMQAPPEQASPLPREVAQTFTPEDEAFSGEGTAGTTGVVTGEWDVIPPAPFGSDLPAAVFTGEQMMVVDPETGRTASYDPDSRRWTRRERAPRRFPVLSPALWSGREMLIMLAKGTAPSGLAFDVASGTWREIARGPLSGISRAVWTGQLIIAASGIRSAAYDPVNDCWISLPDIPGGPVLKGLHWTGNEVLAVTGYDGVDSGEAIDPASKPVELGSLDLGTRTWTELSQGPVASFLGDAIWTDDELVFVSIGGNNSRAIGNAAYAPDSDTWRVLDTDCRLSARLAVWANGRLVDAYHNRAFDPASGECLRLPRRGPSVRTYFTQTRSGFSTVWTGDETIVWSGSPGSDVRPTRDGVSFRPAD